MRQSLKGKDLPGIELLIAILFQSLLSGSLRANRD